MRKVESETYHNRLERGGALTPARSEATAISPCLGKVIFEFGCGRFGVGTRRGLGSDEDTRRVNRQCLNLLMS